MATTPVEIKAPTGLTLTLSLYAYGSDTLANSGGADSFTERTNAKGIYSADVTEALTGWHDAKILDGSGNVIALGAVYMEDDTSIKRVHDPADRILPVEDGAIPANASDSAGGLAVVGGTNPVPANVTQVSDDATAAATLELFAEALDQSTGQIDSGSFAANAVDASALATDAVQEIRNAITGGAYALDTDANGRVRVVDGTAAGEISLTSGLIDGITGTKNTFDDLNDLSAAQVNAEADTALTDYDAPTRTELTSDVNSILSKMLKYVQLLARSDAAIETDNATELTAINANGGSGAGDFSSQSDALEAVRDRGDAAWITATGFSTHAAADIWAVGTRTLSALGFTLAASDLASGIITAAKFAAGAIDAAATSADFLAEIQAAVTGGAYALDTDANGRVRVVDGTSAGEINTASGAIVQVDQLGTQAKTDVNAEVVDCLNVDTYAEPGQGTPAATAALTTKIGHLFKGWRNKSDQSATLFQLYNAAGDTVDHKRTVGESGGTVTLGAVTTGP